MSPSGLPFPAAPLSPSGQPLPAAPPPPSGQPLPAAPPHWPAQPYRVGPGWTPPSPPRPPAPRPSPFRARELAALAAIVILADIAAFGGPDGRGGVGGAGLALFFTAVPVAVVLAARSFRTSARLALPVALLAAVALRCAWSPTWGAVLSGFALLPVTAVALRARRVHVPELMVSALAAVALLPSRVRAAAAGIARIGARARVGRSVVLPVLVPTLLSAAFACVFGLANPVVAHAFDAAWTALERVVQLPSIGRVLVWALAAVAAASLLRPAILLVRGHEDAPVGEAATPTSLAVARNTLVALNVLFFAYDALDAAYLWAGSPPPGVSTQIYAHQGTFWLTVALAMLTVVIGVVFRGALAHDPRAGRVRLLAYVWAFQGLVLALGTYRRIAMHVARSGLSDLRIVGILGTTLVASAVVLVVLKLRHRRGTTWLARRQLDALAIAAVVYAVFPTHLVAAHVNVARIASGEYRPLLHMFRQAKEVESAGCLVPLLHHPDHRVRQGVAALLEDERRELATAAGEAGSWTTRDLGTGRALRALDDAAPAMASALGDVDRSAARRVLLEISRGANEDRSFEELLAIPAADAPDLGTRGVGTRSSY